MNATLTHDGLGKKKNYTFRFIFKKPWFRKKENTRTALCASTHKAMATNFLSELVGTYLVTAICFESSPCPNKQGKTQGKWKGLCNLLGSMTSMYD